MLISSLWLQKDWNFGREGENVAEAYLKKEGYRFIEKNFRFKLGEINIIAKQNEVVVFIEVIARAYRQYEHPFNALTSTEQRKIIQVAQNFLAKHQLLEKPKRFDVVGLTRPQESTFRMEL